MSKQITSPNEGNELKEYFDLPTNGGHHQIPQEIDNPDIIVKEQNDDGGYFHEGKPGTIFY